MIGLLRFSDSWKILILVFLFFEIEKIRSDSAYYEADKAIPASARAASCCITGIAEGYRGVKAGISDGSCDELSRAWIHSPSYLSEYVYLTKRHTHTVFTPPMSLTEGDPIYNIVIPYVWSTGKAVRVTLETTVDSERLDVFLSNGDDVTFDRPLHVALTFLNQAVACHHREITDQGEESVMSGLVVAGQHLDIIIENDDIYYRIKLGATEVMVYNHRMDSSLADYLFVGAGTSTTLDLKEIVFYQFK